MAPPAAASGEAGWRGVSGRRRGEAAAVLGGGAAVHRDLGGGFDAAQGADQVGGVDHRACFDPLLSTVRVLDMNNEGLLCSTIVD